MINSKTKLLSVISLALLLVVSLVAVGCPEQPATTTTPTTSPTTATPTETETPAPEMLDIGVIVGLSGFMAETDDDNLVGAELALDWINDNGGITVNGQQYLFRFIVEDNKSTAEDTVAAATKLVEQDQVKFIVGPSIPFTNAAAATVTEPAKVLRSLLYMAGLPEMDINPNTPYTFSAHQAGANRVPLLYDYLVEAYPDVETIAITPTDEPASYFIAELSKQQAEAHGLEVVATEMHEFGITDFYPLWTKVLPYEPDAADTVIDMLHPTAMIWKHGRELGFQGPMFSVPPYNLNVMRDEIGAELATGIFNTSLVPDSPENTAEIKLMVEMWEDRFGTEFAGDLGNMTQGWDAVWCLAQAIEAAQSLDPTDVAHAWEQMPEFETSHGIGKLGGEGFFGIDHVVYTPLPVSRIVDGEVEFAGWFDVVPD